MSPQQAQCPPVMNHFLKAIRKFLSIPGDPLIAKGDRFDRVFALGLDAQATHFLKAAAAGFGISKNKVLFSPDTEIIRKLYTVIRFLVLAGIHEHRIRLANTIGELNFPGAGARTPLQCDIVGLPPDPFDTFRFGFGHDPIIFDKDGRKSVRRIQGREQDCTHYAIQDIACL